MKLKVFILILIGLPVTLLGQSSGDYAPNYYQVLKEGGVVGCSYLQERRGQYFSRGNSSAYSGQCIERTIFGSQHLLLLRVGIEDGVRNGSIEEWYPSGNAKTLGTYVTGQLQGLYEEWNANGTLATRYHFLNDMLEGVAETWGDSGQMLTQGIYQDGQLNGYYEEWDTNGIQSARECYIGGGLQPISECSRKGVF